MDNYYNFLHFSFSEYTLEYTYSTNITSKNFTFSSLIENVIQSWKVVHFSNLLRFFSLHSSLSFRFPSLFIPSLLQNVHVSRETATKKPLIWLLSRETRHLTLFVSHFLYCKGEITRGMGNMQWAPFCLDLQREIFVVSFRKAHIPNKFLVIPLFILAPYHVVHSVQPRTTPKKFLLIVNTIFIIESILIQMEKKNIWKRKHMLYLN